MKFEIDQRRAAVVAIVSGLIAATIIVSGVAVANFSALGWPVTWFVVAIPVASSLFGAVRYFMLRNPRR